MFKGKQYADETDEKISTDDECETLNANTISVYQYRCYGHISILRNAQTPKYGC